jgi:hypothetical protein
MSCSRRSGYRDATVSDRLLSIYLNDQLAAGVLWRELARRSARANRGTEAGPAIDRVATAIAQDVETFRGIMRRLGVRESRMKLVLAVAAERVGRLKLNGRLTTYSPLSRFVELDALAMGIEGKKILWENLRDGAALAERVPDVDFDRLIERAGEQRRELEPFRLTTARRALGEPGS